MAAVPAALTSLKPAAIAVATNYEIDGVYTLNTNCTGAQLRPSLGLQS